MERITNMEKMFRKTNFFIVTLLLNQGLMTPLLNAPGGLRAHFLPHYTVSSWNEGILCRIPQT